MFAADIINQVSNIICVKNKKLLIYDSLFEISNDLLSVLSF